VLESCRIPVSGPAPLPPTLVVPTTAMTFEQAVSSHYIDESPSWLPSDVQSMPRPHNMPGRTGFRQLQADYYNRYPQQRPFQGLGGGDLLCHVPRPSSGSAGVSGSTFEDPKPVLESCSIPESGPAQAGQDPMSPTSSSDISDDARPLYGCDSYLGSVTCSRVIQDASIWSEIVTAPFSVIRYLYSGPVLNRFFRGSCGVS
jgi:hypothetical protein